MGIDPLKQRAVFLDRDGVINRAIVRANKPYPPSSIKELEILPGVSEALERLHAAGFKLIVVTNQPDVARGKQTREAVEEIHNFLCSQLPLDLVLACYHDDSDKCDCRKPSPGMLFQGARIYELDLTASFLVGDRWRDIEAGKLAGCQTVLIDYDYDEIIMSEPDIRIRTLGEAAKWILDR